MIRIIGAASLLIVIQSTAVHADTFKDAVNAAYCIGVDQGEIDYYVKMENLKSYPTEELESEISQKTTFISNAMRAGLIDAATVQKMTNAGLLRINCVNAPTGLKRLAKNRWPRV